MSKKTIYIALDDGLSEFNEHIEVLGDSVISDERIDDCRLCVVKIGSQIQILAYDSEAQEMRVRIFKYSEIKEALKFKNEISEGMYNDAFDDDIYMEE
jgi:hypothetical protein